MAAPAKATLYANLIDRLGLDPPVQRHNHDKAFDPRKRRRLNGSVRHLLDEVRARGSGFETIGEILRFSCHQAFAKLHDTHDK